MNRSDISGEQQAQEQFGTTNRAAAFQANQILDHLNGPMQQFIARQEMAFIATASASGACDCSFRAGTRGFVAVLDEKTLVYPEYRGNGVLASVGNIMENPHIGMVFLDYYLTTMGLHVNGKAHILTPGEMEGMPNIPASILEAMQIKGGRRPEAWIQVNVEEAYVHCSKHVPLMKRLDKHIAWGSDDDFVKGGDFFRVKKEPMG